MNELIFLLHIIFVTAFTLGAFYMGKNALLVAVALQAVLANLFVIKQIEIFGFNATCADVFIVGSVLGINLLQEYYGKTWSKKALYVSFFGMLFYLVMTQIHLFYIPAVYDNSHLLFEGILKFAPRIIVSSISVYFIVLFINNWFYGYLKNKFENKYLLLRNFISIILIQFLDTVLFVFVALYGIVESVLQVMFVGFVLKVMVIFVSIPFIGLAKKFFSKKDISEKIIIEEVDDAKND